MTQINRLRAAAQNDANWNALIHLYAGAALAKLSLEDGLEEIRGWFCALRRP